jgi:hypothetical protein
VPRWAPITGGRDGVPIVKSVAPEFLDAALKSCEGQSQFILRAWGPKRIVPTDCRLLK